MDALALVQRLHEHRAWTNGNLLNAVTPLPEATLQAPFAIGQGSLWKSLVHMHAAEWVWLQTLLGNESPTMPGDLPGHLPGNQLGSGAIESLDELRDRWQKLERLWREYLATLSEADLDVRVPKVSYQGVRHLTRRGDILMHVCLHANYTAAQVVNMLRQAGVTSLPETMLITLARQLSPG